MMQWSGHAHTPCSSCALVRSNHMSSTSASLGLTMSTRPGANVAIHTSSIDLLLLSFSELQPAAIIRLHSLPLCRHTGVDRHAGRRSCGGHETCSRWCEEHSFWRILVMKSEEAYGSSSGDTVWTREPPDAVNPVPLKSSHGKGVAIRRVLLDAISQSACADTIVSFRSCLCRVDSVKLKAISAFHCRSRSSHSATPCYGPILHAHYPAPLQQRCHYRLV